MFFAYAEDNYFAMPKCRLTQRRAIVSRLRIIFTALLTACMVAVGFVWAGSANAADVSSAVVKDITIVMADPSDTDLNQWDGLDVTVAIDSNGQPVNAGDSFQVGFPSQLLIRDGEFPMTQAGEVLANCVAASATSTIVCTFTAAAAAKQFVSGSISAHSQAIEAWNQDTVTFQVGGSAPYTPITATLPGTNTGIGAQPDRAVPTDVVKAGYIDNAVPGRITWRIQVPEATFGPGAAIKIMDTLNQGATLPIPSTFRLHYFEAAAEFGNPANLGQHTVVPEGPATQFTVAKGATQFSTPVTLAVAVNRGSYDIEWTNTTFPSRDGLWELYYESQVPAGTTSGTIFSNDATVNAVVSVSTSVEFLSDYEGVLEGPGLGAIEITKTLSGPAADLAVDHEFTIAATWTQAGVATGREVKVKAGTPVRIAGLPAGTVVTLSELATEFLPARTYTPTFQAAAGVTVLDDGTAHVTVGDQTTVAVTLDNAVEPHIPKVEIVKADLEGNDANSADDAVDLTAASGAASLVFTITNRGSEAVRNLVVRDVVVRGGTVSGLSCLFPGSTIKTSANADNVVTAPDTVVLESGHSFDCTANLTGVTDAVAHLNSAGVTGVGVWSGQETRDSNDYNAFVRRSTTAPSRTPTPAPTSSAPVPSATATPTVTLAPTTPAGPTPSKSTPRPGLPKSGS